MSNDLYEGFRQLARAGVAAVMQEDIVKAMVRGCMRLAIMDMLTTIPPGTFATGGLVRNLRYRVGDGSREAVNLQPRQIKFERIPT
jgi:hypothetical protein